MALDGSPYTTLQYMMEEIQVLHIALCASVRPPAGDGVVRCVHLLHQIESPSPPREQQSHPADSLALRADGYEGRKHGAEVHVLDLETDVRRGTEYVPR
jgi:hypothetical protein